MLAAGASSAPAAGGAWPQAKGEGLTIVSTVMDRADTAFGADRETIDDGYFYKDETAVFAEYGLGEATTLVARFAWQNVRRRNGNSVSAAQGLAASEIGVRQRIWQAERQVFSVQGLALIPGQGENVSNQPLGDGDTAFELRGLWGRSIGQGGFAEAQLAWRWRDGRYLDEARLDATIGWVVRDRWHVTAQSFSVWNAEPARPGAAEFDQHKLQLSLGRDIGTIRYEIGGWMTPTGRNSIDERAAFISVWRRF